MYITFTLSGKIFESYSILVVQKKITYLTHLDKRIIKKKIVLKYILIYLYI